MVESSALPSAIRITNSMLALGAALFLVCLAIVATNFSSEVLVAWLLLGGWTLFSAGAVIRVFFVRDGITIYAFFLWLGMNVMAVMILGRAGPEPFPAPAPAKVR